MNKRKFPITNIGSVSLLMIFIVLCMVTFAALSLSTAATDHQSAQTLADHTSAYYKASNKAEKKLAETESILQTCYHASSDADSYYQLVRQKLNITETAEASGPLTYSFKIRISKSQKLSVRIKVIYPATGKPDTAAPDTATPDSTTLTGSGTTSAFYQITCWKSDSASDWNADNSLKLIQ